MHKMFTHYDRYSTLINFSYCKPNLTVTESKTNRRQSTTDAYAKEHLNSKSQRYARQGTSVLISSLSSYHSVSLQVKH